MIWAKITQLDAMGGIGSSVSRDDDEEKSVQQSGFRFRRLLINLHDTMYNDIIKIYWFLSFSVYICQIADNIPYSGMLLNVII